MKHTRLLISVLTIVAVVICFAPFLRAQEENRGNKIIRDIEIQGTEKTNPNMIKRTMRSKEGEVLDEEELIEDLHRIWEMGYFKPGGVKRLLTEKDDGYYITIVVEERDYVVGVDFKGNDAIGDNDLAETVTTKPGGFVYEYPLNVKDIQLLKDLYVSKSYFNVEISSELKRVEEGVVVIYRIEENAPAKIERVTFIGNKNIPSYELRRHMDTEFGSLFSDKIYRERIFENDLENIRKHYRGKGFFENSVEKRVVFSSEDNLPSTDKILALEEEVQNYNGYDIGIYIYIIIDEGPRYRFGRIDIVGNKEEIVPASVLREKIKIEEGDFYSVTKLNRYKKRLMRLYGDKGYARANISHEEEYDFKEQKINTSIMIDEGGLYYIEDVRIIGNTRTKMQVLLREIDIAKGDKFNYSKLLRSQRALTQLGLFKRVMISQKEGSARGLIIIVVEVEEDNTGVFQVMLSYGERTKLTGTVELRQRNFDILGMFKGHFTGAAHNISLRYIRSPTEEQLSFSFKNPRLFDGKNRFSTSVAKGDSDYFDYSKEYDTFYLSIGRELFRNFNLSLGGAIKDIDNYDVDPDAPLSIQNEEGLNRIRSIHLNGSYSHVLQYTPGFPSEGYYLGGGLEFAGDYLNATRHFVGVTGDAHYYKTLFQRPDGARTKFHLYLSGKVSNEIEDETAVPLSERVRLGGAGFWAPAWGKTGKFLRGYQWGSIGPNETDLTGDAFSLMSAECIYPLKWDPVNRKNLIQGVIFFDAGAVWKEAGDALNAIEDLDSARVRSSTGIGIRMFLGGQPIAVEFYWSLPFAKEGDDTQRFQFTIFGMPF